MPRFLVLAAVVILLGALALAVYTTGVLGRLMAESVDNLDERPLITLIVLTLAVDFHQRGDSARPPLNPHT